jgi:hypothetical protein
MIKKTILTTLLTLSALSQVQALEYSSFSDLDGQVFDYPGPNCFAVAMMGSGHLPKIRGVDVTEFSEFLNSSCIQVKTPQKGDIGVFHSPDKTMLVHAYVYIDQNTVMEKTGVDYVGQTPIHIRDVAHTFSIFEADPLCKRYSPVGNRDCYNVHSYYTCPKNDVKTNISEALKESMHIINTFLEDALTGELKLNNGNLKSLELDIINFEKLIAGDTSLSNDQINYLKSIHVSYEKQYYFLK